MEPFSRLYRAALLGLLMLVFAFGYVDRVMVQTLGQSIKEDLGLSDLQLGALVGLGFAILYSVLGLPIARMAERSDRIRIISISVGLFSVMSLLCGMAGSFLQLFAFRIGVGIGEAGVQSPASSLVADHYPPERRGLPLAIIKLGSPLGSVVGATAGGLIAHAYGWRVALMATAAPGILLAIAVRLILREPPRGQFDPGHQAQAEPPPLAEVVRVMWGQPAFRHCLMGLGLATMGLYSAGAFVTPFFMRVHHLTIAQAGGYFATLSGISATVGMLASGLAVDFVGRRGRYWSALLPAIGLIGCAPLYCAGYLVSDVRLSLLLQTFAGILLILHSVPTLALFQSMVGSRMRATAAFFYFLVSTLVGIGLGPPLIGFVSDLYTRHAFTLGDFASLCPHGRGVVHAAGAIGAQCAAASATGLREAMVSSVVVMLWASVHYLLGARALHRAREAAVSSTPEAVAP